jgi:membrane associated rhomboid family serine protease
LWLPSALFFGGWIKVVLEQPGGAATPYAEWLGAGVVAQAHLFGAACGTVLGLLFAISDAHATRHQQRG